MYRVKRRLVSDRGTVETGVCSLSQFSEKTIKVLLERGVVETVQLPPLEIIPGMDKHISRLRELGIVSLEDYLEADADVLEEEVESRAREEVSRTLGFIAHPETVVEEDELILDSDDEEEVS